jgi:hypothetical protein
MNKIYILILGLSISFIITNSSHGDQYWAKTLGGSESDIVHSALQTSDGGFVIAGCTSSFGTGEDDFWLVKLDCNGNVIWEKTYGEN